MNGITGSILILHGRTPKIVIQPFDGSWKCQAESALEALSDAPFWSSAIGCTRRKVRAMQASLSIWSGAGFSTYRRSQDVGGQFGFRNVYLVGHGTKGTPLFPRPGKRTILFRNMDKLPGLRRSVCRFRDCAGPQRVPASRTTHCTENTEGTGPVEKKMDTLDARKDTQTDELRARGWYEERDIRSRRTTAANFTCYAKITLSHTMSMNPDDNGNLPPVTFRSHPWLA